MDRRVRRTRENLKKALIDLIHEKDFESITILDLSERADVNRGTFYHHYFDKIDLLEKIIAEKLEKFNLCLSIRDRQCDLSVIGIDPDRKGPIAEGFSDNGNVMNLKKPMTNNKESKAP